MSNRGAWCYGMALMALTVVERAIKQSSINFHHGSRNTTCQASQRLPISNQPVWSLNLISISLQKCLLHMLIFHVLFCFILTKTTGSYLSSWRDTEVLCTILMRARQSRQDPYTCACNMSLWLPNDLYLPNKGLLTHWLALSWLVSAS